MSRTKADMGAVQYYRDVKHSSVDLTEEQEIALFNERELVKTTDAARLKEIDNTLVLSVIKMANEIALRYASKIPGIDIKDAIQEANEAIIDSLRLYNPQAKSTTGKRIKFGTFAHYKAEFRVKEYIMNNSRLVRLPRSKLDELFLMINALEELSPGDTIEELHVKVNELGGSMQIEDVYKALELLQGIHTSLDQAVRNDSVGRDQTLKDIIPVPEEILNPEQEMDRKMALEHLNVTVKGILEPFDDMTYEVIFYRFLDPKLNKMRTYEETAKAMHNNGVTPKVLSREWVRQLETAAINRIREDAPELEDLF